MLSITESLLRKVVLPIGLAVAVLTMTADPAVAYGVGSPGTELEFAL